MNKENNTKLRNQRFKERLEKNPDSIYNLMKEWDIETIDDMQKACRYVKDKDDVSLVIDHIHYKLPQHIIDMHNIFSSYYDLLKEQLGNVNDTDISKLEFIIFLYNKCKNTDIAMPIKSKIDKISVSTRIIWGFNIIKELFEKLIYTINNYADDKDSQCILINSIVKNSELVLTDIGLIEKDMDLFNE